MALQMDYDEVITQGGNISARAEEVAALQRWLHDVVNNQLPSLWQGNGYQGFVDKVMELDPSFDAMKQLIEDIGQGVVKNAEEYKAFDESVASANRGA